MESCQPLYEYVYCLLYMTPEEQVSMHPHFRPGLELEDNSEEATPDNTKSTLQTIPRKAVRHIHDTVHPTDSRPDGPKTSHGHGRKRVTQP